MAYLRGGRSCVVWGRLVGLVISYCGGIGVGDMVCATLGIEGGRRVGTRLLTGCGGARWGSKGSVEGWPCSLESAERMVWKKLGRGGVLGPCWWDLRGTLVMVAGFG